jgi:hypothetical protein
MLLKISFKNKYSFTFIGNLNNILLQKVNKFQFILKKNIYYY